MPSPLVRGLRETLVKGLKAQASLRHKVSTEIGHLLYVSLKKLESYGNGYHVAWLLLKPHAASLLSLRQFCFEKYFDSRLGFSDYLDTDFCKTQ